MDPKTPNSVNGNRPRKIGLALSGGGFRASIFHLGVIRRLEELGIMKDVAVISTVSGGSIIGVYYVCEMERRMRERRAELNERNLDEIRLIIFESISEDFFEALGHNLRTRALVFSPFYHPLLFLRSLWPTYSRSDIMQKEYDRFFFRGNPLDQLPSVTRTSGDDVTTHLTGPKLVINTTSLLSGERKTFSREPISSVNEMKKVNKNVTLLSRIVGASAGVPGLFPPTQIAGDTLVDGGVSDNQGLDGLLKEGREYDGRNEHSRADYDLIIVSDASGQMEQLHQLQSREATVLMRTFSVFQHGIRNKETRRLKDWARGELAEEGKGQTREAALVHLYLNLKDRPSVEHRVPSEYIAPLARIRTDLDQFSTVEREALMYHGYTLIDAQIREKCPKFMTGAGYSDSTVPPMKKPPLFDEQRRPEASESAKSAQPRWNREQIKRELKAGAQSVFLLRSIIKYRFKAGALAVLTWVVPVALLVGFARPWIRDTVGGFVQDTLRDWWTCAPGWLRYVGGWLLGSDLDYVAQAITKIAPMLVALLLALYLFGFLTYVLMRRFCLKWDNQSYLNHTGVDYSIHWE